MYNGGDGMHRHRRDRHFLSVQSLDTLSSTGEDLHCKCCCDLSLEETMAPVSGERAPAFSTEELEKLVDEVLPQYTLLYGPPEKQHAPEEGHLACHRQGSQVPGGLHCQKRWEDFRPWSKKTAEAQLGMASQRGRGAPRTMTPLMFRILAVAYLELDGRLRASPQQQGGEYTLILLIQRAL
ncbi:hypothetical protein NDU88_003564 [Pleurodeles waltl]|uniref:Uncharacterized protein n=1 Tax=Pleurodeles waltl TaxID=8319 RepID=A0AAV7P9Z7_PLEWA|nr:hypothetical protein NDU88_003564 [Pleurodeles waltl]